MKTEKWTTEIDILTGNFIQTFGELSEEELNWKPNEQTWSIAQNLDHLIVINESYYPILEEIRQGTYKLPITGRIGIFVNLFGKLLLKSVQPDTKKKTKTFAMWEPTKSTGYSNILERFKNHQEDLKQLILNSRDMLKAGTVISSPASRLIVYKLETAFDIIVAHERRHFQQAKEVLREREQIETGIN